MKGVGMVRVWVCFVCGCVPLKMSRVFDTVRVCDVRKCGECELTHPNPTSSYSLVCGCPGKEGAKVLLSLT